MKIWSIATNYYNGVKRSVIACVVQILRTQDVILINYLEIRYLFIIPLYVNFIKHFAAYFPFRML